MPYNHRYHIFVATPDEESAACQLVRGLFKQFGDGGEAEDRNCRTPLVDANGKVVGWVCSFVCGDTTHAALLDMIKAGKIPAEVFWCRSDALGKEEGRLRATNHPKWQAAVDAGAVLHFDLSYTLEQLGVGFQRSIK